MKQQLNYPIRAVSKLTGLSIDTLRAWEKRYQAVVPLRDERGRMYTESDLERLNLLRAAVDKGHAIGRVAALTNQQLRELLELTPIAPASELISVPMRKSQRHLDLDPFLEAVERYDYLWIDKELGRLAVLLPARELMYQVVLPLMRRVGIEWHQGKLSIAQEHMVSSLLCKLLGSLMRLHLNSNPPARLLFATPSGEQHEFGILSSAMLATGGGLGILYLGCDLPAEEVIEVARRSEIKAVVLGVVGTGGINHAINSVSFLARHLPLQLELWIGGTTSEELIHAIKQTRAQWIPDFETYETHLKRLGARF
jgi:DNA-binding transcriptional MerR regulator